MGRASDTRAKVRALATVWTQEGRPLSPRAVREALGGGSSTTIVDELRRFREEHASLQQGDEARATLVKELAGQVTEAPAPAPVAEQGDRDVVHQSLERLRVELEKSTARFDAMQKRLYREVDEARETARYWRNFAEKLQSDMKAQIDTYRNGMYREMERANVLAGRLEEMAKQKTNVPST